MVACPVTSSDFIDNDEEDWTEPFLRGKNKTGTLRSEGAR